MNGSPKHIIKVGLLVGHPRHADIFRQKHVNTTSGLYEYKFIDLIDPEREAFKGLDAVYMHPSVKDSPSCLESLKSINLMGLDNKIYTMPNFTQERKNRQQVRVKVEFTMLFDSGKIPNKMLDILPDAGHVACSAKLIHLIPPDIRNSDVYVSELNSLHPIRDFDLDYKISAECKSVIDEGSERIKKVGYTARIFQYTSDPSAPIKGYKRPNLVDEVFEQPTVQMVLNAALNSDAIPMGARFKTINFDSGEFILDFNKAGKEVAWYKIIIPEIWDYYKPF